MMKIRNWRYDDGWHDIPHVLRAKHGGKEVEFIEEIVGWHCWAYPDDNGDFAKWMEQNMKGNYDCDFRFNSGDPMFTITIKDPEDATLFKLTWL
jgi:hypothetical protein